jgi:hypothetical protein
MVATSAQPRRFQFSLKRLLIGTGLAGLLLALASRQAMDYHRSTSSAESIAKLGGSVSWNPEIAENVIKFQTISRITDVRFTNPRLDAVEWQSLSAIPHRFGLQIDGQTFTDDALIHLVGIPRLEYVTLDNTRVTEAGVIEFQRQRPDVTIMFGYPHDSNFNVYPAVNQ